jgi:uncharacterized protein (TIGR03000 family)
MAISRSVLLLLFLVTAAPGRDAFATAPVDQAAARTPARAVSRVTVIVPDAGAELEVDGKPVEGTGTTRTFDMPAPPRAGNQRAAITARWKPNTYTTMTRTKTVSFRAGDVLNLDLSREDPDDRVRVIYVPTPPDIAEEMVKLAGVTASDVVYEPGCGDARITIAAMKSGARRGLCVDIDAERVEESRAKVKEANFDDRIEVRHGDALDVREMSDVTVVFLYMGDHFDMLIRPVLWKQLKVGSRVVSHRFTMGDWKPDRTVSISSAEGGDYELHLWTITEEVKRRAREQ